MRLPDLVEGRLLRRYQRFMAEVELEGGERVTAHCANTGSMRGCLVGGARVWLSRASNPGRKLAWTWDLVEAPGGALVGVVPLRANLLAREALESGLIPDLAAYPERRAEVRYGEGSRVDWLLQGDGLPPCYLEVKSVTLVEDRVALFPDAVSARAGRHLRELAAMLAQGARAGMLFCVQRADAERVEPADRIDPAYGAALREAIGAGVEAWAVACEVTPAGIRPVRALPVRCS